MSLIAWNCRGLANLRAVRFLKEINNQYRPSLIFLCETLVKEKRIKEVCKAINFAGYHCVDAQGHGGGLALLWKNEGGIVIKDSCSNFIDFEVSNDQVGRWRYTGFYGFPERGRRRESWDLLKNLAGRSLLPWCIIGDYNDIVNGEEKNGRVSHPRYLCEGFANAITDCNLSDLGFRGERFTWERGRGSSTWVQERLDRGLATQSWKDLFPRAEIQVLEVSTSDHLLCIWVLIKKCMLREEGVFGSRMFGFVTMNVLTSLENAGIQRGRRIS